MSSSSTDEFKVSGPLPVIGLGVCPEHFSESEVAHWNYASYRSAAAACDTTTFHAVSHEDEVAGFISFRVAREDGVGSTRIFFAVEHIYVLRRFPMRRVSELLTDAVVREIQSVLHVATGAGRRPKVYLHSATQPESPGGNQVLRAMERELLALATTRVGVALIGQHYEHPPGARERLWAHPSQGELAP